jgi:acyl-CoA thioester hydrolase
MNAQPHKRDRMQARPFLQEQTLVRVRFHEVDSMRVVWHGHYVAYFEEARRAFGRRYGIDYPVFTQNDVAAPVVQLHINYLLPARLNDVLEVSARLYRPEAVKIEFAYDIRRQGDGALLTSAQSVQVLTQPPDHELILVWPPFMLELLRQWEPLWIHPPAQ